MASSSLRDAVLAGLQEDTADYWVDHGVPVLERCSVAQFMREGYSRYHPVILRGLVDDWPALALWSKEHVIDRMGNACVSVNLTPDGQADSVQSVNIDGHVCTRFVYPAEVKMTMANFFAHLERRDEGIVPYLSQQNDNLRTEFAPLLQDIRASISLAEEAFGVEGPEAVNLWIGDERSVSSLHKDHYENFYAVISGAKTFTLLPPTDVAFLPSHTFPTARYVATEYPSPVAGDESREATGPTTSYTLSLSTSGCPSESLEWIPIDPNDRAGSVERYPSFAQCQPLQCTVLPGEVLYLPAMWYHRVSQTVPTVAVNFWYDMRFDFRFVFYQAAQRTSQLGDKSNLSRDEGGQDSTQTHA